MKNGKLVGSVKEVWRYPVKSMQGEQVTQCDVTKQGVAGDRGWAIKDSNADEIRGVRKIPKLLHCQATYACEPVKGSIPTVNISTPNGKMLKAGDAECEEQLSTYLNRPVSVWPLQSPWNLKHYRLKALATSKDLRNQFGTETTPDISSISLKLMLELAVFATPLGRYYDCYPLHILTCLLYTS
ncbi:MAG: MOSC domain-containing protein, partial [Pseudomonadales bacterium]|nr:MOSC domain-containing protein [Pseudomonadales bacterium]